MVKGQSSLDGTEQTVPHEQVSTDLSGSFNWLNSSGPTILTNRQSRSLASAAVLDESYNPYAKYAGDTESLDDGIHMDLSVGSMDHDDQPPPLDMPPDDVVLREFTDYMDAASPLSEPEEVAMQHTSTTEKWRLIRNQQQRSPIFPVRHYIENLKNQGSRRRKFSIGRNSSKGTISPLTYLLRKLKLDLKMSPTEFVEVFVKEHNGGIQLLMKALRDAQVDQKASQVARKRSLELKSALTDESDCLLCLKFAIRATDGQRQLCDQENSFDLLVISTLSSLAKCRATALQILSVLSESTSAGYHRVMDAMARQQRHLEDSGLFKTLVTKLNESDDTQITFVTACVRFFNALTSCVSKVNARVHLQHEIHLAGFKPDHLNRLTFGDHFEQEELARELEIWRQSYVKVHEMGQDIAAMSSRNQELRQEVDRLQNTVKEVEKSLQNVQRGKRRVEDKSEDYRERAAELQDTVEKLSRLYEDQTGQAIDPGVNVEDVLKPLDQPTEMTALKYATIRSTSSLISVPEAPPAPPPAPPMFLSQTVRNKVKASVDLPFLNWTPIHSVKHTLFQDIDDEAVYREIDFTDFESRFRLPMRTETPQTREKRERTARIIQGKSDKVMFVNINRSKNISITKHRTGLTASQIRDAIDGCDISVLPGEYAELLTKFIPSNEELKLLAQHSEDYWKMGEAEQLLFQLSRVERLETKLNILAFLGIFEELVSTVKPNIYHVLEASNSILSSHRLKKLFEIILAFGNYMNSSRRGYTFGFRLESLYKLSDVKPADKRITFLNYLVELIEGTYPDLLNFYEDFNVGVEKGVSYHGLQADVMSLRKGLDQVKFEREKQPNNPVLQEFYSETSELVSEIAESFKKMEDAYRDVCLMFGENFKRIEPYAFFKIFIDFIANYKEAQEQNRVRSIPDIPSSPGWRFKLPNSVPNNQSTTPYNVTPDYSPQSTPEQTPLSQKKEVPKILASLAPQVSSKHPPRGQSKWEHPKGPVVAHPHMALTTQSPPSAQTSGVAIPVTPPEVASKGDATEARPPQKVTAKMASKMESKKGPAPVPQRNGPAETDATMSNGLSANHKVTPGPENVSERSARKEKKTKEGRQPLKVVIPQRPRTSSEPTTADVTKALATLDQIVDYEEQFGGTPSEVTCDSYL